jgi:glycosyltransferase involved in cell wall biosynthesis
MHIAINCRPFLKKNYTGIGRYTHNLIKSLSEIDDQNQYQLYAPKRFFSLNKRLPAIRAKNFFLRTDRFNRGLEKSLGKIDIYHSPSPETLNVKNWAKIIVTVHDLIFKTFPQGHTRETLDQTEKQFKSIMEIASQIICCSKSTLLDLQKYFPIPKDKIELVYQGVDKNLFYVMGKEEEILANKTLAAKGIEEPYILSVGTIEPRKNLKNLLAAFCQLKAKKQFTGKLVVAGMKGWMSDDIDALISKLEIKNHVIFLGYLSDDQLRYFYNKAHVFVFPSFYEGFGFPIVEAFCCGTPVVTSNVSSCPEIAQDAALIRDPYNPEDIAEGIAQLINDQALRQTLREKGFRRAGDFSFRKTAQKTLGVYEKVYRE